MQTEIYRNRADAGHKLAEKLSEYVDRQTIVLAIPCGGVPIGIQIAEHLQTPFDIIVTRKIPIPWNTDAGFGAVTADGTLVINERLVHNLRLTEAEMNAAVQKVQQDISLRSQKYRRDNPAFDLNGKTVILVDDGLASGYTMMAAIEEVKKQNPSSVVVAVPVASNGAVRLLGPKVDYLVSLITSERLPFAVADFYSEWHEMTDEEVCTLLGNTSAPSPFCSE